MCGILFLVLWILRKKIFISGIIAGTYLIFTGLERFIIEKIRVNSTYTLFGLHPTQAEVISVGLMLFGLVILLIRRKKVTSPK